MNFFSKIKEVSKIVFDNIKIKIRNVTQEEEFDCGPATVCMMLSYYKINYSLEKMCELLNTGEKGTGWTNIANFLRHHENFVVKQRLKNIKAAREFLRDYPLMICWQFENVSHYSVLVEITGSTMIVMNPWDNKKYTKYDYDDFYRWWKKYDLWFAVFIRKEIPEDRNQMLQFKEKAMDNLTPDNSVVRTNTP